MKKIACIFIGNGKLLIACYHNLIVYNFELKAVISDDTDVIKFFKQKGIPCFNALKKIELFEIDYIFSINNSKILQTNILKRPQYGAINFHNSLLPYYSGYNATSWAILNGEKKHGVTWHFMSESVDTGDILEQEEVDIIADETTFSLNIKCFESAIRTFNKLCHSLTNKNIQTKINFLDKNTLHYFSQKPKYNGIINCCADYHAIVRMINACNLGPYDNTFVKPKLIIGNDVIYVTEINEIKERNFENFSVSRSIMNEIEYLTKLSQINERRVVYAFEQYFPFNFLHESYFKIINENSKYKVEHFKINFNEIMLSDLSTSYCTSTLSIILSVFVIYLFKSTNQSDISIAFWDASHSLSSNLKMIYSNIFPCNLRFSKNKNLKNVISLVNHTLSYSGVYSLDILERYHILNELKLSDMAELFPIIIGSSSYSPVLPNKSIYVQLCKDHLIMNFDPSLLNKEIWNTDNEVSCEDKLISIFSIQLNTILSELYKKKPLDDIVIYKKIELNSSSERITPHLLHDLFINQANRTPDRIAIIDFEKQLTYRELLATSCLYAKTLIDNGIKANDKVIIFIDKGWKQIVACLATLIAGGCYVPVNIKDPDLRLVSLFEQSSVSFILSDTTGLKRANEIFSSKILKINDNIFSEVMYDFQKVAPNQPAYIIFTSGTTGKPKGVIISHNAVCNTIIDINKRIKISQNDKILFISELFFDLSVYDIFGTLAIGAMLVIPRRNDAKEPQKLIEYIKKYQISIWNSVPTYFLMLLEYIIAANIVLNYDQLSLRIVMLSGDWIPTDLPQKSKQLFPSTQLLSLGGATEASIWSIYYHIDLKQNYTRSIPYGYSLSNQKVWVLNQDFLPCAPGVIGKIYITGVGLAQGYIANPKLTDEHFIKHTISGEVLYYTGDLGKYYEDGCIGFCGRNDGQIKISGHRIELKEIEVVSKKIDGVEKAIALTHKNKLGHMSISLFVKYKCGYHENLNDIKDWLKSELPVYMIPSNIIILDKFPRTINGKINYSMLSKKARGIKNKKCEDKSNMPKKLVSIINIWEDVLKIPISSNDNFIEIGGNSLSAIQILSRVQKDMNISYSLSDFYQSRTPLGLYQNLDLGGKKQLVTIQKYDGIEVELSSNQKRLWFLNQQNPLLPFYNMLFAFDISGEILPSNFKDAFDEIIEQFDVFRSIIILKNGVPHWKIEKNLDAKLNFSESNNRIEALNEAQSLCKLPFNLGSEPLFRVALIKYANDKYFLFIIIHHIIFDGWSFAILINALNTYFNGSYKSYSQFTHLDYCNWQNKLEKSEQRENDIKYWSEKFTTYPEDLNFPLDMKRGKIDNFSGKNFHFEFSEKLSSKLKNFTKLNGLTMYSTIFSAFAILLHKYTLRKDIIIGSSYANRSLPELEGIIGFLANTLVLKLDIFEDNTFIDIAHNAHNIIFEAIEHQSIGFDKIIEIVNPKRLSNNNPIFQVALVLLNLDFPSIKIKNVEITPIDVDINISKFDFTVYIYDQGPEIKGYIEYNTDLFLEKSISQFINYFEHTLSYFVETPNSTPRSLVFSPLSHLPKLNTEHIKISTRSILDYFIEHVERTPNHQAIVQINCSLTYYDLYKQSLQVAHYLQKALGNNKNKIIGFYLTRSPRTIAIMIGILISGNAFVPLDLRWPQSRIKMIISDSEMVCLISSRTLRKNIDEISLDILLEEEMYSSEEAFEVKQTVNQKLDNTAYFIYTSGTTGYPKGVSISHRNLISLFDSCQSLFHFSKNDKWLQFHSYAFDFSIWEIFGALYNGATLVIPTEEQVHSPVELINLINDNLITVLNQTPTAFYQLLNFITPNDVQKLTSLKYIIFGGEPLNFQKLDQWLYLFKQNTPELINMYGITETTVHASFYKVPLEQSNFSNSIIGQLLGHFDGIILDKHRNPLPPGMPGELYLWGDSLSKGYLNRAEENKQKFIDFAGVRAYKSGDLVRLRLDNKLEYFRRLDRQAKIRGYRIELEEIENILVEHQTVQNAVVIVDETNETLPQLRAFVILKQKQYLLEQALRDKINTWTSIFNDVYHQSDLKYSQDLNIAGWVSAFTKHSFSKETMSAWLQNALKIISLLAPRKILEIGCGTGMILFNTISLCEQYVAIDTSEEAIRIVNSHIMQLSHDARSKIDVYCCSADNIHFFDSYKFDTVILNSIVQYFPNIEYFDVVIRNIIDNMGHGRIFIGDIRNFDLLNIFHENLKAHSLKYIPALCNFNTIVSESAKHERELLISPNYFLNLKLEISDIKGINFFIKDIDEPNELNIFRYEVVIFKGDHDFHEIDVPYKNWKINNFSIKSVDQILSNGNAVVGISYVPNRRGSVVGSINQWLSNNKEISYSEIFQNNYSRVSPAFNDWKKIAENNNFDIYFIMSLADPLNFYHVVFIKKGLINERCALYIKHPDEYVNLSFQNYSNSPEIPIYPDRIIRSYLKERLPSYALPNSITLLEKFPLNSAGKIDMPRLLYEGKNNILPIAIITSPANNIETTILNVWKEYLRGDSISPDDNFFEIGGDSIISLMIVSRLKEFGIKIGPKDLFRWQTIRELALNVSGINDTEKQDYPASFDESIPLSPIQSWFFRKKMKNYNHWNYSFELEITQIWDQNTLEIAIRKVVNRHDVFSMRYVCNSGNWTQTLTSNAENNLYFRKVCEIDFYNDVEAINKLHKKIDLETGPLIIFILKLGSPQKLFVITHHLVMDSFSVKVLTREIEQTYLALINKQNFIGARTVPYAYWLKKFYEKRQNMQYKQLAEIWSSDPCELKTLYSFFISDNFYKFYECQHILLSMRPDSFEATVSYLDILTAAVSRSLMKLFKINSIKIDMERHARDVLEEVDTGSTIGWLVSIYPLLFNYEPELCSRDYLDVIRKKIKMLQFSEYTFGFLGNKIIKKERALALFNFNGSMLDNTQKEIRFKDFIYKELYDKSYESAYLIEITASLTKEGMNLFVFYNRRYLAEYDIHNFFSLFKTFLDNFFMVPKKYN